MGNTYTLERKHVRNESYFRQTNLSFLIATELLILKEVEQK